MRRFWTPEKDAAVRAARNGGDSMAVVAARLGVSVSAVKCRAVKIGALVNPRWTPSDDAVLRLMYPTSTAAEIAAELGVSEFRVANRVDRLDLLKQPHWPAEVLARVRVLNAAGKCDREIRDLMPGVFKPGRLGFYQVKAIRRTCGLPYRRDADAKRRAIENQKKALGIRHGGDLQRYGFARFAERNGWPADLPPRCVQILNVLCERGPMTALQLAAAIGASTDRRNGGHGGPRLLSCSNRSSTTKGHSTYTGLLKARGLIQAASAGGGPGSGKGRRWNVYSVTLKAITTRQEILDERQRDGGAERGAHPGPDRAAEQVRHPAAG